MSKNKSKKEKKSPSKKLPSTKTPRLEEEEKRFDFGGLPDRDLKKNLGCG